MPEETQTTIILPVYGRAELLGETLDSIAKQSNKDWKLIIADDGSDAVTHALVNTWTNKHGTHNIQWVRREKNLGLFSNLNRAIEDAQAEWVLIVCSDDLLLPDALDTLALLRRDWPEAGLILSTFNCINLDGSKRFEDHAMHHDKISRTTDLLEREYFLQNLLRFGSLNGNITGMAIHKRLWVSAGAFREEWRHAADWEWLIRAGEVGGILLNRKEIAVVRTHELQLSNANRESGHELKEVSEVVQRLKTLKEVREAKEMEWWAAGVMKHQLLNVLRRMHRVRIDKTLQDLDLIGKAASIPMTSMLLAKHCAKVVLAKNHRAARRKAGRSDVEG